MIFVYEMMTRQGFIVKINYDADCKRYGPSLRNKSVPVPFPMLVKDQKLGKSLLRYVHNSRDEDKAEKYNLKPAVGLAAPQVGVFRQMIAVVVDQINGEDVTVWISIGESENHFQFDPIRRRAAHGETFVVEVEHPGFVYRSAKIKIKAIDVLNNEEVEFGASGYLAIVLQHEIDHLSGILFYDHINESQPWEQRENAIIID